LVSLQDLTTATVARETPESAADSEPNPKMEVKEAEIEEESLL